MVYSAMSRASEAIIFWYFMPVSLTIRKEMAELIRTKIIRTKAEDNPILFLIDPDIVKLQFL